MKRILFAAALLTLVLSAISFNNLMAQKGDKKVRTEAEVMPQYIDGDQALIEKVSSEIKYPEEAKKAGVQGKVFVQFIVDKQGSVQKAEVIKGIGHGCDDEAVRVVNTLKFKPGKDKGKPVDVQMVLPFQFKLQ